MRIGSLFSGIGGLELGLERGTPGAHTVWQVEIDEFCTQVLEKHWPKAKRFADVRAVGAHNLPAVDLVCRGFPCQDVSSAGKRAGLSGEKSGLWFEYLRIVSELRPRFVVVENVTSGKKLWLPQVKEGLGSLGYRTSAFALSAAEVGAPHLRRRVFVVADADGKRQEHGQPCGAAAEVTFAEGSGQGRSSLRSVAGRAPHWSTPPVFRRVDDGVPRRVDRLRALGNAVVPQCAEVIGKLIANWPEMVG